MTIKSLHHFIGCNVHDIGSYSSTILVCDFELRGLIGVVKQLEIDFHISTGTRRQVGHEDTADLSSMTDRGDFKSHGLEIFGDHAGYDDIFQRTKLVE